MQQCYIKLFLSFVFLPRYFVESLQLTWTVIAWNVGWFSFLSLFFWRGGRFCSEKALNRNLNLGFYFCIPASITIPPQKLEWLAVSQEIIRIMSYVCASWNRRAGWLQVTCVKTSVTLTSSSLISSSTREGHEALGALAASKGSVDEHFIALGS